MKKVLELVEKKGADAISMRRIAKKMNLSAMAIYRHFSCKDALLLEVAAHGFDLLTQEGNRAARGKMDPRKKLESVLMAYYRFGQKHGNLFELMFGPIKKREHLSEKFRQSARNSFSSFSCYVHDFLDTKTQFNQDRQRCVAILWSLVHGTTVLAAHGFLSSLDRSPKEMEAQAEAQIAMVLDQIDFSLKVTE